MSARGEQEEREVFDAALELPPEERERYLDSACSGDAGLAARVRRLLRAHEQAQQAATLVASPAVAALADPGQVGPYRILERIGEGGMGVVYLAEQERPVRRSVALKVIKLGMDTREVIARFESERQALALMSHPNIARILDAGATDEGRPYFVMEYVPGVSITEYCDREQLSIERRLELFLDICFAVQHAHQKGVVHRDLKPSNVLVSADSGDVAPKIIDFGIAKATERRLTDLTLYTRQGLLIGTPEYMAPEQAAAAPLDVDTRADVYSLGVVFYELLTGVRPLELERSAASAGEIQSAIRTREPAAPSTRVRRLAGDQARAIAHDRSTTAAHLARKLRGELGWISAKALEKDRARRYQTAQAFAEDVQRFLHRQPVLARRPSLLYSLTKFVQRHAAGVAMTAATLALTVSLVAYYTLQLARERDRANLEAATTEQVRDFLVEVFSVSNPDTAAGRTVTARELLDRGAERVMTELSDEPAVQATLMQTIGQIYIQLAQYEAAEPLLRESLRLSRRIHGDTHADLALSLDSLAHLLESTGDYRGAEPLYREALEIRRALFGEDHEDVAQSLNNLALLLNRLGEFQESERLNRRALASSRTLYGDAHPRIAGYLTNLGYLLLNQGRLEEAEEFAREALAMQRKVHGQAHTDVAAALNNLAGVLVYRGDYDGAEPLFAEALAVQQQILPRAHPDMITTMNNLGVVRLRREDYTGATQTLRETLALRRESLGQTHPDVAGSLSNLARALDGGGETEAALPLFEQAVETFTAALGADHWRTLNSRIGYGRALAKLGRYERSEQELLAAHDGLAASLGAAHRRTRSARSGLIALYDDWGRPGLADEYRALQEKSAAQEQ